MDPLDKNYAADDSVRINQASQEFLLETARWAKFLSSVGFIFLGITVITAVALGALSSSVRLVTGIKGTAVAFIFIAIALLYFFPVYYLYNASVRLKKGLLSNDEKIVASGFESLKSHYKFVGILTIVILSFYAIFLIIAILGAM